MKISSIFMMLVVVALLLFWAVLTFGSVSIPAGETIKVLLGQTIETKVWSDIILIFRLPKAITAILVGVGLALSGLQMQTLFRNPLAGPFVLGISSGAGLGVALYVMAFDLIGGPLLADFGMLGEFGLIIASTAGALSVLLLILLVSFRVQDSLVLLIVGVMLGYVAGGIVQVLLYFGDPNEVQTYITWTFGSLRGVTTSQLILFSPILASGALITLFSVKQLNAFLLGETYAKSLGINVDRFRVTLILSTALMAGSITAFSGPIGFIGIAIPHLCRGLFQTSDHRILIPAVIVMGTIMTLAAELIAQLPGSLMTLPLNAVTALLGAPVVIYVVLKKRFSS